jgi:hypothetical protein
MSARQRKCGKYRQKRKVSIDDMKGDIAAKYQDLGIVRGSPVTGKKWSSATNRIRI